MNKINLNTVLLDLSGKKVEGIDETLGQIIGSALANYTDTEKLKTRNINVESLKLYEWAKVLYANKELQLDSTDFDNFKNIVEATSQLSPLVRGQIREILNKL